MTLDEAKLHIKKTTMYGNENAPIGSSARSYFESELRSFIDGYNKALEDAKEEIYIDELKIK